MNIEDLKEHCEETLKRPMSAQVKEEHELILKLIGQLKTENDLIVKLTNENVDYKRRLKAIQEILTTIFKPLMMGPTEGKQHPVKIGCKLYFPCTACLYEPKLKDLDELRFFGLSEDDFKKLNPDYPRSLKIKSK